MRIYRHMGICDASAAIALDATHFVVASDEDNLLRLYRADKSGPCLDSVDISRYFKRKHRSAESDIEGATLLGDTIYWITSHGRSRKGEKHQARYQFFANRVELSDGRLHHGQVGKSYGKLLADMLKEEALEKFRLAKASKLPPKAKGGLNIEGLGATPDGAMLIGFRNPIRRKKALIVPLLNPRAVLGRKRAKFAPPITLDLDGLGIRSIDYWPAKQAYLIVAGTYSSQRVFRIYTWSGDPAEKPRWLDHVETEGVNPEAVIVYPGRRNRFHILSDDGAFTRGDVPCKRLPDGDRRKYFRSYWAPLIPPRT